MMKQADAEGELYLSAAASLLYEKLGGDPINLSGGYKMASPTAALVLTELLMVFDLDWWKRLKKKFTITI